MESKTFNVCVTGAAGQIGYAFVPLLLTGQVFGPSVKINLRLLDIPACEPILKGVVLEIEDCAYPLLNAVETFSDPKLAFKDLDVGVFIGGFPRKEGMERKDLLAKNCGIFKEQGQALEAVAKVDCKILVVANPANTNCMTLSHFCPKIPRANFTALTRLDHNRAKAQLALKAGTLPANVHNCCIWGNHSSTQYPDVTHGTINGKPVHEVIADQKYLQEDFIVRVQKRGAEIITARKGSSVFSAANGAKDHLHDWFLGNSTEWVSMGVMTDGQTYGVKEGICFSFPIKCLGNFKYEIVTGLPLDDFSKGKLAVTEKELLEEKAEALA